MRRCPAPSTRTGRAGRPRRSQFRMAADRFVHQRLAMVGLGIFVLLLLGVHDRAAVLAVQLHARSPTTCDRAVAAAPVRHRLHRQRHVRPGHGRRGDDDRDGRRGRGHRHRDRHHVGAIAGFYGRLADSLLMRFVDLVLVVPMLAILIVLSNKLSKQSSSWVFVASSCWPPCSWTYVARLVRGDFLSLREREFVEAAHALGATDRRIIVRHMLPNAIGPHHRQRHADGGAEHHDRVDAVLPRPRRPAARCVPGQPDRQGQDSATDVAGSSSSPSLFLIVLILSIFLIGDGLREAFDPRRAGQHLMTASARSSSRPASRSTSRPRTASSTRSGASTSRSARARSWASSANPARASRVALATMGLLPKDAEVPGRSASRAAELLALKEKQLTKVRGTGDRHDLPGPDDVAEPRRTPSAGRSRRRSGPPGHLARRPAQRRAIELLAMVGIPNPAERVDNYPHEFSGGMRQRAVIAIAMANDPEVILADEPTTALDVTVQAQVLESLQAGDGADRRSLLLITHDLGVIAGLADRVMVMYAGQAGRDRHRRGRLLPARHAVHAGPARLAAAARRRRHGARCARSPAPRRPCSADRAGCPFAPRCPLVIDLCLRGANPRWPRPSALGAHWPPATTPRSWPAARPDSSRLPGSDGDVDDVDRMTVAANGGARRRPCRRARPPAAARGHRPGQAFPDPRRDVRPAQGRRGPRRLRGLLQHRRRGDARPRRRVGLREVDDRRAPCCSCYPADLGLGQVRGHELTELRHRDTAADAPGHPGRLPGPVRLARPPHAGRRGHRRAPADPRRGIAGRRPATGRRDARAGRARAVPRQPLPQRVLRRPAPAGRHRPGAGPPAQAAGARRAGLRARRLHPGRRRQPARGPAGPSSVSPTSSSRTTCRWSGTSRDRVAVMYLGKIVEIGTEPTVYETPAHPYTQALAVRRAHARPEGRARPASTSCSRATCRARSHPPSGCRFRTRCWKAQEICATEEPALVDRGQGHPVACHFAETAKVVPGQ